jgi:anti-anti-sigma factor
MGIAIDENESESAVTLEGAIDIASAAEFKAVLVKALGTGKKLSVSLLKVSYLDVTAVQLLWSAGQQAQRTGMGFSLSGHLNEPISLLIAEAGFPTLPDSVLPASANVE